MEAGLDLLLRFLHGVEVLEQDGIKACRRVGG
jgi:hypothetical protein